MAAMSMDMLVMVAPAERVNWVLSVSFTKFPLFVPPTVV